MKKILFLLASLSLFWGCDNGGIEPQEKFNQTNTINLGNPAVGQKTYYQQYTSNCGLLRNNFEYVGDTIVVEVLRKDNKWQLAEYFTPNSTSYIGGRKDSLIHSFVPEDTYVLIPERWASNLFNFYGNDTIHLQPSQKSTLIQKGCRLEIRGENFVGNEIGELEKFEMPQFEVENKTVVSCVPMILNLDGYLMYDRNELYVSHTVLSDGSNNNQIIGWVRL